MNPVVKRDKSNVVRLAKRCSQAANERVIEQLFDEHHVAMRAFLRRRQVPDDGIDDVIQEVFTRLAKMEDLAEKIRPEQTAQRGLLYTMANNVVIDLSRRHKLWERYMRRESEDVKADFREVENNPESLLSTRQDIERVKEVIATMKPTWRRAFVLSRFKYLTYRQIADDMGVSVKQVEKYMKQALLRIRDAVTGTTEERDS